MTDKEQNDLQALDTITRLQARLDAAESLAVCLFEQLPRQDQHGVMDAVLDRTEAVADAKIPLSHLETYRTAAQKLQAVLLTKLRVR